MGLIGCNLGFNYKENEKQEELKMREDGSLNKIYVEYNTKNPQKTSEEKFITRYNYKNNKENISKYEKYIKKYENKNKLNGKMNLSKKIMDFKKRNGLNTKDNINNDEDELIIITPKNNYNSENYNNDITDEFTIKNETVVYYLENSAETMKYACINEIKEENKLDLKNGNIENIEDNNDAKTNKLKINEYQKKNNNEEMRDEREKNNNSKYSKSFITKRKIITKKPNLNKSNQEIKGKNANIQNGEKKYYTNLKLNIDNKKKNINGVNRSRKNSGNNKNHKNKNSQRATLENKNIKLNNLYFEQMPLMKKEEILPNIEHKTYQEDLVYLDSQLSPERKLFSESKNKCYIINENNPVNDDSEIVEKLNNIYHVLYNKNSNSFMGCNENNIFRKSQSPDNIYLNKNNQIFRKGTEYHIRNKTSNSQNLNYINNNNQNNNSFFSLFNNSTNLSINFINKSNRNNKSARSTKKEITYVDRHNNSCREKFSNRLYFNKKLGKPFMNYSNYNINKNPNNNKPNITNYKSYNNNILNNKMEQNSYENNIKKNYSMHIITKKYKDLLEINFQTLSENFIVSDDIINNIQNNKYKLSFKILDTFDTEKIIYDGIIYKAIDNLDNINNDENNKYKLIDRYFQITKNCFKYYNNFNEAINEKEKPLVQFDIRYIKNIEIIDSNFLKNCTINENKKLGITFCVCLNQINDFFVFTHNDINIGNNIINILIFLKNYYEDKQ